MSTHVLTMRTMRGALLLTALLLPWGHALGAATDPVSGELRFDAPATLDGAVAASSPAGGLDLARAVSAGEPLRLSWTAADGYLIATSWTRVRGPLGPESVSLEPDNETVRTGAGELRALRCEGGCKVLLVGLDASSDVRLAGRLQAALAPIAEPALYFAVFPEPGVHDAFSHAFPVGSLRFDAMEDAIPSASGALGLLVVGGTLEARLADGTTQTLDARYRRSGNALVEQEETRFLFLHLQGARFEGEPGSAATLLAPRARVDVDGTLASPLATGALRMGRERLSALGSPVEIDGRVALDAAATEDDPSVLAATVEGEATRVRMGDATQREASAARATGVLAVIVAALLVLAPLYSRIQAGRVLDNPRRRAVYDLIRVRPGICAVEIARDLDMGRMVAEHHVRLLMDHQLVVRQAQGKKRRLFLQGTVPQGPDMRVHLALEDATRRAIAETLRAVGGPLTQRELVERTGLSQRLVSYHLSCLGEAGLVRAEGGLPRGYAATPLLEDALAGVARNHAS